MCICLSVFICIHVSMYANAQYVFAYARVYVPEWLLPPPPFMCVSIAGLVEQRGLAVSLSTGVCDLRAWCEHFSHPPA